MISSSRLRDEAYPHASTPKNGKSADIQNFSTVKDEICIKHINLLASCRYWGVLNISLSLSPSVWLLFSFLLSSLFFFLLRFFSSFSAFLSDCCFFFSLGYRRLISVPVSFRLSVSPLLLPSFFSPFLPSPFLLLLLRFLPFLSLGLFFFFARLQAANLCSCLLPSVSCELRWKLCTTPTS